MARRQKAEPILVGSRQRDAATYLGAAWALLDSGGTALDAVVLAARAVEDDVTDRSVGIGGRPNCEGVVELDASIMDGSTGRFGGIGALRGYAEAITVARAVLEQLPHLLVVGEGARQLAADVGLAETALLTPESEAEWREWRTTEAVSRPISGPAERFGTVNILARDQAGHLAAAVSTSGWAWKYPGRLGDSPIIGAGIFADDHAGAAACTGFGEASMWAGTARTVVRLLRNGDDLNTACTTAMQELAAFPGTALTPATRGFPMTIVALDAGGHHGGVSTEKGDAYAVWNKQGLEEIPRVPIRIRRHRSRTRRS